MWLLLDWIFMWFFPSNDGAPLYLDRTRWSRKKLQTGTGTDTDTLWYGIFRYRYKWIIDGAWIVDSEKPTVEEVRKHYRYLFWTLNFFNRQLLLFFSVQNGIVNNLLEVDDTDSSGDRWEITLCTYFRLLKTSVLFVQKSLIRSGLTQKFQFSSGSKSSPDLAKKGSTEHFLYW